MYLCKVNVITLYGTGGSEQGGSEQDESGRGGIVATSVKLRTPISKSDKEPRAWNQTHGQDFWREGGGADSRSQHQKGSRVVTQEKM